jgi:ribosome-binding ATPase YchF (GTP1/OBG family)
MNGLHRIDDPRGAENGPSMTPPTPLFERLVTEEVQELKSCLRMIDNQQRRLDELERVHGDLESRLELESRGRSQLETTLEEREREWAAKFQRLEADRDHWKHLKEQEESKTKRLMLQLNRKDQDIHRMLQRKVSCIYEKQTARCLPFSNAFSPSCLL